MAHDKFRLMIALVVVPALLLAGCAKPLFGSSMSGSGRTAGAETASSGKLREKSITRPSSTGSFAPPQTESPNSPALTGVSKDATNPTKPYRIRQGDTIIIFLRDLPGPKSEMQLEDIVDDQGMVNLPLVGRMTVAGKTTSESEHEIENAYIENKIYRRITVNVVIPQQIIFVTGEVKISNKFPLVAGMTLLQAIATAGGATDYADLRKVQLIRGGKTTIHNAMELQKNPEKDIRLEAGDQIVVPRGWY